MTPLDHIAALRAESDSLRKQDILDAFAEEHLNELWLEQEWMALLDAIGGPDEKKALDKLQAQYERIKLYFPHLKNTTKKLSVHSRFFS